MNLKELADRKGLSIVENVVFADGKAVARTENMGDWTVEALGRPTHRVIVQHPSEQFENDGDLCMASLIHSQTGKYARKKFSDKRKRQAERKQRLADLRMRAV